MKSKKAKGKKISCAKCGQSWDRDPALEVTCPVCKSKPGIKCKIERPSEHKLNPAFCGLPDVHPLRDLLAMKKIPGYKKCTGKNKSGRIAGRNKIERKLEYNQVNKKREG